MQVMVTGGAGYIGSVVTEELIATGHTVTVFDNLTKGRRSAVPDEARFVEGDLSDVDRVRATLSENDIEAVIHMAAFSLVGESISEPGKYYLNNMSAGLSLLSAMVAENVTKMVFSSTAAVYGEPEKQPITEQALLQPTNPYGETKLAFERALRWFDVAHGLRSVSLRYFNAAGATEKSGEWHEPETHLIPLIFRAALGLIPYLEVFGDDYPTRDGTCIRDYIHVSDLARAHVRSLDVIEERSSVYNLGCGGAGYTVAEVINTAREILGIDIPVRISPRRQGDPAMLIASSDRIKADLAWEPTQNDLSSIIGSAWTWTRGNLASLTSTIDT